MKLTPTRVIEEVCRYYDLDKATFMQDKRRFPQDANRRHLAMWLIYNFTELSMRQVGELFAVSEPSVFHAIHKVNDDKELQTTLREDRDQLWSKLETLRLLESA